MAVNNMNMGPLVINIRKREQIQVVASLEGNNSQLSTEFVFCEGASMYNWKKSKSCSLIGVTYQ